MFNIGPQELLIVLILALIVVGPQKLPELSRQIGRGLREFRKVQDEVKGMVKLDLEDPADKPAARRPASPTSPGVHRTPRPAPATSSPAAMEAARPPVDDRPPAAPPPETGGGEAPTAP